MIFSGSSEAGEAAEAERTLWAAQGDRLGVVSGVDRQRIGAAFRAAAAAHDLTPDARRALLHAAPWHDLSRAQDPCGMLLALLTTSRNRRTRNPVRLDAARWERFSRLSRYSPEIVARTIAAHGLPATTHPARLARIASSAMTARTIASDLERASSTVEPKPLDPAAEAATAQLLADAKARLDAACEAERQERASKKSARWGAPRGAIYSGGPAASGDSEARAEGQA